MDIAVFVWVHTQYIQRSDTRPKPETLNPKPSPVHNSPEAFNHPKPVTQQP